jgi:hypothetical protein
MGLRSQWWDAVREVDTHGQERINRITYEIAMCAIPPRTRAV